MLLSLFMMLGFYCITSCFILKLSVLLPVFVNFPSFMTICQAHISLTCVVLHTCFQLASHTALCIYISPMLHFWFPTVSCTFCQCFVFHFICWVLLVYDLLDCLIDCFLPAPMDYFLCWLISWIWSDPAFELQIYIFGLLFCLLVSCVPLPLWRDTVMMVQKVFKGFYEEWAVQLISLQLSTSKNRYWAFL